MWAASPDEDMDMRSRWCGRSMYGATGVVQQGTVLYTVRGGATYDVRMKISAIIIFSSSTEILFETKTRCVYIYATSLEYKGPCYCYMPILTLIVLYFVLCGYTRLPAQAAARTVSVKKNWPPLCNGYRHPFCSTTVVV